MNIQTRLMMVVLPIVIIIFLINSIITNTIASGYLEGQAKENSKLVTASYSTQLNSTMTHYLEISMDLGKEMITSINVERSLQVFRERYPIFTQVFYTPNTGKVLDMTPYRSEYINIDLSVYKEWDKAFDTHEAVVTPPGDYFDSVSIIIFAPVVLSYVKIEAPKVVGMIALVLPLDTLMKEINLISNMFIIDSQGTYIYSDDSEKILQNIVKESRGNKLKIIYSMIAGSRGFGTYSRDGEREFISFSPISRVKWSLGQRSSYSEITAQITRLTVINIALVTIGLIIIFLTIFYLIRSVMSPIKDLMIMTSKIEEGEYSYRIDNLGKRKIGGEFLKLITAFNSMTEKLSISFNLQREEINQRKAAEIELKRYRWHLEDEVKNRTRELDRARLEAESANRAKSEFLANMSHEIRTPMNAVLGFTEILKDMEEDSKKAYYIDHIHTSGKSLLNLINDILDLSKIESGKMDLQYSATSLNSLLNEVEVLFRIKMEKKGLNYKVIKDPDTPESLILDDTRLRQIFINLIGNALKFTHSGSVTLTSRTEISSSTTNSKVDLTFYIEDTGIGIPEDQLDSIFNSFEQVKGQKNREYGGTGLGLAITRKITELMGGNLKVTSTIGRGSRFTLYLPNIEIAAGIESEEALNDNLEVEFESSRVLVVDDIDYNREIITHFLSLYNLEIREGSNGEEAVYLAKTFKPDIILLDMKMPVMDGYKASEIIKSETENIPIIAITASALKQDEDRIAKLCDGYLRKPISRAGLINEIKKYLNHREIGDSRLVENDSIKKLILPEGNVLELIRELALNGDILGIKDQLDSLKELSEEFETFIKILTPLIKGYEDEEISRLMDEYLNE